MSKRFAQYQVVLAREPDSFWRENVIAVVILLRECRCGGNKFFHFAIGRGLNFTSIKMTTAMTISSYIICVSSVRIIVK